MRQLMAGLLGLALVLGAGCQKEAPRPVAQPRQAAPASSFPYELAGLAPVTADADDPVVKRTIVLVGTYRMLHSCRSVDLQSLVEEHNEFAGFCGKHGLQLKRFRNFEQLRKGYYSTMSDLSDYLLERHWFARFNVLENNEGITIYFGRVAFKRRTSVQTVFGQDVEYDEVVLVEDVTTPDNDSALGVTSTQEISSTRTTEKGSGIAEIETTTTARSVVALFLNRIKESAQYSSDLVGDKGIARLVRSVSVHERQHVADAEVMKGVEETANINVIKEVRANLRMVAKGRTTAWSIRTALGFARENREDRFHRQVFRVLLDKLALETSLVRRIQLQATKPGDLTSVRDRAKQALEENNGELAAALKDSAEFTNWVERQVR